MRVLITGAAGFIGGNLSNFLTAQGCEIMGLDNFSPYYSTDMKRAHLDATVGFKFEESDITEPMNLEKIFRSFMPEVVVHLAAQGGVRASKINPLPYLATNQLGFLNMLELSEKFQAKKFIYASSSSVYGDGLKAPFKESYKLPAPKSLYALSKLSNENIAQNLPSSGMQRIGLRFFTVYGPWGRPDMAIFRLLASSLLKRNFELTANLDVQRDFTFVEDVSKTILSILRSSEKIENEIFNVAGSSPFSLAEVLAILQDFGVCPSIKTAKPDSMDVQLTHGSTKKIKDYSLHIPSTDLRDGIRETLKWMEEVDPNHLRNWLEYSQK